MRSLVAFMANNFIMSVLAGIGMVAFGAVLAFKADNKFGYWIILLGLAVIVYTMKLRGLF